MPLKARPLKKKNHLNDQEKLERTAVLLIREIDRILFDLEFRRNLLFKLWSRERTRKPLLRTLRSRYYELGFDTLVLFAPDVSQMLDDFYRTLDAFIFYISYTQDLPQQLTQHFDTYLEDLQKKACPLLERLKIFAPDNIEVYLMTPSAPQSMFEDKEGTSMSVFEDTDPNLKQTKEPG